jgi:hypothetical protein
MVPLRQFDYDVFLSYGWAGILNPIDADRGWVAEFKSQLTAQLSGELGFGARVYFDLEDSQNGTLPARLDRAAASAVVFVSVITPGSCRADSWCHRELAAFADDSALVLPDRKQLFSVLLRDVDKDEWPEALRPITPYEFLTTEPRRRPLPQQDLADSRTPAGVLVQRLAMDIADAWHSVKKEVDRTVLLGWTHDSLDRRVVRLADEIAGRGGKVLRVTHRTSDTEDRFATRIERQYRNASFAVHLIAGSGQMRPDGWNESIESHQIQASARRFSEASYRTIVWHEPIPGQDLRERSAIDAQILRGSGFEYLQSVITDCFERHVGEPSAGPGEDDEPARYVFIKCVPEDAGRLDAIRAALESRGMRLRLPLFQGDEYRRNLANQALIERSHGIAVYFGSLNDLEAFDACQTLGDAVRAKTQPVPKAVLLDPSSDPIRRNFWYPDFKNFPSSDVELFADQVLGAAAV